MADVADELLADDELVGDVLDVAGEVGEALFDIAEEAVELLAPAKVRRGKRRALGLLVLLGLAAVVYVIWRKKRRNDDEV